MATLLHASLGQCRHRVHHYPRIPPANNQYPPQQHQHLARNTTPHHTPHTTHDPPHTHPTPHPAHTITTTITTPPFATCRSPPTTQHHTPPPHHPLPPDLTYMYQSRHVRRYCSRYSRPNHSPRVHVLGPVAMGIRLATVTASSASAFELYPLTPTLAPTHSTTA